MHKHSERTPRFLNIIFCNNYREFVVNFLPFLEKSGSAPTNANNYFKLVIFFRKQNRFHAYLLVSFDISPLLKNFICGLLTQVS